MSSLANSAADDQLGLPFATPLHRFGAAILEATLAILTLGIGWFVWWLILLGQGLTPARQILGLRIGDTESYATWEETFRWLKSRGLQGVFLSR